MPAPVVEWSPPTRLHSDLLDKAGSTTNYQFKHFTKDCVSRFTDRDRRASAFPGMADTHIFEIRHKKQAAALGYRHKKQAAALGYWHF